ncbi:lysophospholipid acyltransferase family protein [Candidatus Magnetominusculus dajiuhuensis]|uniref:lysophospholipid acyltransferase family protein n=1 Tax=Candidatus Magnetominusculus dajiuhuensis TaxID=3137712 RepID=UPI003B433D43
MRLKESIFDIGMWVFWFPLRAVAKLLPLKMAYSITRLLASLVCIFYKELRDKIKEQLVCIVPDKDNLRELDRLSEQTIVYDLKRRMEELLLGTLSKETIERIITYEGCDNLKESVDKGRGTIILLSHFGSFFMILPALAFKGYRISQIVGPSPYRNKIQKMILRARHSENAKLPVRFIFSENGLRPIFNALKNNELIAMALDGRAGDVWVDVQFFGRTAHFSQGILKLAIKTGATILPTYIIRQQDDTHRLVFERPIFAEGLPRDIGTVAEYTQRLVSILEGYVSKYPSHFAMIMTIVAENVRKGIYKKPLFKPVNSG